VEERHSCPGEARESRRHGDSECTSVVPDDVRGPDLPSARRSTGKEGREQPQTSTASW